MSSEDLRITPKGLKTLVAMVMTGEAGEHHVDPVREGSLLQLANRVADRCRSICGSEEIEMSDEVYSRAIDEVAPQWAEEGA